jgi:hypothetical protein
MTNPFTFAGEKTFIYIIQEFQEQQCSRLKRARLNMDAVTDTCALFKGVHSVTFLYSEFISISAYTECPF